MVGTTTHSGSHSTITERYSPMSAKERLAAITNVTSATAEDLKYQQYSKLSDADIANLVVMVANGKFEREYAINAVIRVVEERPALQV